MHCTLQVAKAAATRYLKMEPLSPVRIYEVKTVAAALVCLRTLVSFWHGNLSMRFIFVESTFFPFNPRLFFYFMLSKHKGIVRTSVGEPHKN